MAARGLLAQDVGAYACVRLQTSTHARVRPPTGGQETLTTCPSITSAEGQLLQRGMSEAVPAPALSRRPASDLTGVSHNSKYGLT